MLFSIKKRVCFCDTDAGGIMYHSKYLDFCEEARLEYFLHFNMTQKDLWIKHKLMFVLKKCEVNYKRSAKAEDLLTVSIENINIDKLLINMNQNIYRNDELLVETKISLVAVDIDSLKPIRKIPDEVKSILLC